MAVLRWFWEIIKSILNAAAKLVVGALVILLIVVLVGVFSGDGMPSNMVVELDARGDMPDKAQPALFELPTTGNSIMEVVLGLDAAARDARVKGIYLRVGSGDLSIAKAEELRDALKRFRARGKFVIAHAQSFYSGGLGDYGLAASADEIWMQPAGSFFSSGAATSTLFFKGLFDKLEAQPQFVQRYEYKNAANTFTQTDYTEAHREATTRLLQSWYDTAITESAADRKMEKAAFAALIDQSPSTVEFAKANGLITSVGYDDEASTAAAKKAGGAKVVEFKKYYAAIRPTLRTGDAKFALIHAAGEIVDGDGANALNSTIVAGDRFAEAVRDATRDSEVQAIVLRVDSPGGSAIASDQIRAALQKARDANKPVVVSMGGYAASGGYYISLASDRIVAQPGTLTGSIGVIFGKFAIGQTLALAGVNAREIAVGKNALFLSGTEAWNEEQLAKANAQADYVYDDFTKKVAASRKMPLERVQEIARGRVWTGADAKERGLVDELGGFWKAVDLAKGLTKVPANASVAFKSYPTREGFIDMLSKLFESSEASLTAMRGINALLSSAPMHALLGAVDTASAPGAQFKAEGLPR